MTTYGITDEGFVAKTLAVIKEEVENAILAEWPNARLDAPNIFGVLNGIFSDKHTDIWELMEDVYNSQYPDTAEGASLDNVGALVLTFRLAATKSTVTVTVTGTNGTNIPAGTLFARTDSEDDVYETLSLATIAGGTADINCRAVSTGATPTDSVTVIVNAISGLDTVATKASTGVEGRAIESDAVYRQRIKTNNTISKRGTPQAIRGAVLELNDDPVTAALGTITDCFVVENDGDTTDATGRPPHSFETYVIEQGGGSALDDDAAQAIWDAKGVGIQTHGDVANSNVVDDQGISRTVNFSRGTEVPLYAEITLTYGSDYPTDGDDQIKAAVVEWGNALGAGVDALLNGTNGIVDAINDIAGVVNISILKIDDVTPCVATTYYDIDDGTSGDVEISTWATARITVSSTPA